MLGLVGERVRDARSSSRPARRPGGEPRGLGEQRVCSGRGRGRCRQRDDDVDAWAGRARRSGTSSAPAKPAVAVEAAASRPVSASAWRSRALGFQVVGAPQHQRHRLSAARGRRRWWREQPVQAWRRPDRKGARQAERIEAVQVAAGRQDLGLRIRSPPGRTEKRPSSAGWPGARVGGEQLVQFGGGKLGRLASIARRVGALQAAPRAAWRRAPAPPDASRAASPTRSIDRRSRRCRRRGDQPLGASGRRRAALGIRACASSSSTAPVRARRLEASGIARPRPARRFDGRGLRPPHGPDQLGTAARVRRAPGGERAPALDRPFRSSKTPRPRLATAASGG